MKLNLGCADNIIPGYLNVDLLLPNGDLTGSFELVDLRQCWPWKDNSIEFIYAADIIEHLPDKIHTMNEIFRVLEPNGVARIIVPTTDGPGAWQDPTHVSYWNRNSFKYYERGNIYRDRFAKSYGIIAEFDIINATEDNTIDGTKLMIELRKPEAK